MNLCAVMALMMCIVVYPIAVEPAPISCYVVGVMSGIPESEFAKLKPQELDLLKEHGSVFGRAADGTYTWKFPWPDTRISLAFGKNSPVRLQPDGSLSLSVSPQELAVAPIRLYFSGQLAVVPPPMRVVRKSSGVLEVQIGYQYRTAGCRMQLPKGDGGGGNCGSCTACIDNNGYYSWTCSTSQWIGFPGSDCGWAWAIYGKCGFPNDPYCNGSRNCSPLIRHSPCWHRL